MITPLTITSLNQGKIYKDWTLEPVDDTPPQAKFSLFNWLRVHGAVRLNLSLPFSHKSAPNSH